MEENNKQQPEQDMQESVNEETKELVVGIIDYFRCYDIIKKIGKVKLS